MNKSVLPMDSVSFDSVSLSKSKKPLAELDVSSKHDSFAERLSQSQRDLAKDRAANKAADNAKENANTEKPKTRIATEHQSDAKKPVQKESIDQRQTVSDPDTRVKTDKANFKEEEDIQNLDQEYSIDNGDVPVATVDSTILSVQETGFPATADVEPTLTEITQEMDLLASEVELDSEKEALLAETSDELITKGVDAKIFTENYLKGMDTKPKQPSVEVAALSEIVEASNSLEEAGRGPLVNTPAVMVVEAKLAIPTATVASSGSEVETNKNGMDLPLEFMLDDAESTSDTTLDEFTELTGEIKSDDKSTKADLFKSLLAQSQNEKSSLTEKVNTTLTSPLTAASTSSPQLATANRLFVPQTQLGANVANPHWGNAVGEKILWMANQQLSTADIRLDPPELGSLQVRVSVQQDQANITFISPHPQVRELLDQQVTRLREMFAEQGLQLGQVDVADRREQESRQSDDEPKSKGRFVSEESGEVQVMAVSSLYLVDQFV